MAVSELGVADIRKAVELLSVPPEVERETLSLFNPILEIYVTAFRFLIIISFESTNLCFSWDCQAKAALDSTFLLEIKMINFIKIIKKTLNILKIIKKTLNIKKDNQDGAQIEANSNLIKDQPDHYQHHHITIINLIIPPTTSRECTSIVQMVIT